MGRINFVELAELCVKRYEQRFAQNENEKYAGTLFVCILEDNSVQCSTTSNILQKAHECLLIHATAKLAVTNWYSWYKVEYINTEGCALYSKLDGNFNIHVDARGKWSDQVMSLLYENEEMFSCKAPFIKDLPKMWELYTKLRELKTESEIKLVANLFNKDEKILDLEKKIENFKFTEYLLKQERDQYKELLDIIKNIVGAGT